jgi:hypothetical protein
MRVYHPKRKLIVEAPLRVTRGRIADLLCSALEGGSTYWCDAVEVDQPWPEGADWAHEAIASGECPYTVYAGGEKVRVNGTVPVALRVLATEYPEQFELWLEEQDDADTGDIFFQLCVFGEVIYG